MQWHLFLAAFLIPTLASCASDPKPPPQEPVEEEVLTLEPANEWLVETDTNGQLVRLGERPADTKEDTSGSTPTDYIVAGQCQKAEKAARAILQNSPRDGNALAHLAAALVLQGNYKLAAYYAGMKPAQGKKSAELYNLLGITTYLNGRYSANDRQAAQTFFQLAAKVSGNHTASTLNLASLHLDGGRYREALKAFRTVDNNCPVCIPAKLGMAICYQKLGDFKRAKAKLEEVIDYQPGNLTAMFALAMVFKDGFNDKDSARDWLNELLAISENQEEPSRLAPLAQKALDGLD